MLLFTTRRFPRSFHAVPEHLHGFLESSYACFCFFCFSDPAAVLLAVCIAEFFKSGQQGFFLQHVSEIRRNFDRAYSFVLPNLDLHGVARLLTDFLADRLKEAEYMSRMTIFQKRSLVRHTVECSLYRHVAFGAEFFFDIIRKKYECSSAGPCLNLRFEFVFFHRVTLNDK